VLNVQLDGSMKIRLEIGLAVKDNATGGSLPTNIDEPNRPGSMRQSAVKFAGLLQYLWYAATLIQWRPY
jgi:hypothetical protein